MHPTSFRNEIRTWYRTVDEAHGWAHIVAVEEAAKYLLECLMDETSALTLWGEEGLQEAVLLHDVGRALPDDLGEHETLGASLIEGTPWIMTHLGPRAARVVAAVRYHRASSGAYQGGDMLVKVLRDADRLSSFLNKSPEEILNRAFVYGKAHHPDLTDSEQMRRARDHMRSKYGHCGYAMDGLHFAQTREVIESLIDKL